MRLRRIIAASVATVLAVTLGAQASAGAEDPQRPKAQADKLIRGGNKAPVQPSKTQTGTQHKPAAPVWPAGTADVEAPAGRSAKAGPLPVTVHGGAGKATVRVLDRAATAKAKVTGLVVRVEAENKAKVSVDYSGFASAYGADWGSRLRLVELPECALSTPDSVDCAGKPVASRNDGKTVESETELAPQVLLAVTAAPSGAAGDFSATSLQPSSTWSAGGNSGGFSWSYPMRTPPTAGGLSPQVALSYSSQSVDGRMSAANNQPSWIGEGFEYAPGFIERKYKKCADSGDLCWATDNAVLSLNGSSTELIFEEGKGWHTRAEDGSRVLRNTGAANGDNDGEHWVVTASNGTQYWFGRSNTSAWNLPVFRDGAEAQQTWRWNLDYVVDVHGNTMNLTWQAETNAYARKSNASDLASYTRGGWLSRIDYGSGSAIVAFDVADRCLGSNCGTHDATNWPDTPWDQQCTNAPCYVGSPTFWTTKRLSKVTTRLPKGDGTHRDIESWTLHHSFPNPGDGTHAGLWLERISHTGHAAGDTSVPDVSFQWQQLANRVDTIDHSAPMIWLRLSKITNESGGSVNVTYSAPECIAGSNMPANAESNGMRCYPVRWTPPGYTSPVTDWFHKYIVTAVSELDGPVGGTRKLTKYEYVGSPAWHYTDEDGLIEAEDKTWSVWRGYDTVRTITGDPAEESVTQTKFFRGMHGDKLPSGIRDVQLPAAGGSASVYDSDAFAGMARETIVFNGGAEVSAVVNVPWQSAPTATRTIDGQTVHARFTGVGATHTRTSLDGGRAARTQWVYNTFDAYGMIVKVADAGDNAVANDSQCVLTDYVRNTSAWILNTPSRVRTYGLPCPTVEGGATLTKDDVISDVRMYYDSATTHGTAPVKGLVTKVENLLTLNSYQPVSTSKYDSYGRVVESTDAKNNKTTTAYTHNAGGQVTEVKSANHLGWESKTAVDPAFGSPLSTVDPNGRLTELAYDGLGRATSVWLPGRTKGTDAASMSYDYLVRNTGYTVVTTKKLLPAGSGYATSHTLYDGLLRPRQTQSPDATPNGNRVITDTHYDSAGRVFKVNGPYVALGAPTVELFNAKADNEIEISHRTRFDGAGRPIAQIFQPTSVEKWRTSMVYGGDRVDVTPPTGGTPTSTVTDIRGRTVELRQQNDVNTYTYDRKGQQVQVTDAAGNKWTYDYDLRGRQTSASDPDKGTTTSAYNDYNELVSTTDARGVTLAYAYDTLGRKASVHDSTTSGPKRTEWVYDTLAKGKLTKSIRYDGGNAYVNEVTGYDLGYRPTGTQIVVPTAETGLAGTYTYTNTYKADGSPSTTKLPAVGGVVAETLRYGYNHLGMPQTMMTSLGSEDGDPVSFIDRTEYSSYGELTVLGRRYKTGRWVDTSYYREPTTRRLSGITTTRGTTPALVSDLSYTYDHAGNILSQKDTFEAQCFKYDYLRRLTEAWTPSSKDCAAAPSSALGGPAPYWQTWTFDKTGNRLTQVDHATSAGDRTTTSTYPAAGATRPHAVTGTSTVDNSGTVAATYGYDNSGNMSNRNGKTVTWDEEGHVAANDGSSYVYDAEGNRLISRDATGKTLYLPGQELRHNGSAATGTRYYSHAGQTVAARTSAGLTWLINDHQGTALSTVDESTQAITTRSQTPYGAPRGTAVTWPNDKGFVGGTKDPTGLTHLGAREYDPILGRFISVDPLMDLADPQQWNAYGYANGSPITMSDPSGLRPECSNGSANTRCDNTAKAAKGSTGWGSSGWTDGGSENYRTFDTARPMSWNQIAEYMYRTHITFVVQDPVLRDRVNHAFMQHNMPIEYDEYLRQFKEQQYRFDRAAGEILGIVPGVGALPTTAVAIDDFGNGNYGDAAVGILGVVPLGKLGRVSKIAKAADTIAGVCSFSGDTEVRMADGTTRALNEIAEGDMVLASDPETGEAGSRPVIKVWVHEDRLIALDVDGNLIQTTEDHPFWNATDKQWQRADELANGDEVLLDDRTTARVNGIRLGFEKTSTAYNLTVAGIHTYYVSAGEASVLVHNTCGIPTIRATQNGVDHSQARHFSGGELSAGKSVFNRSEMLHQLLAQGSHTEFIFKQTSGNLQFVVPSAGRVVGIDRTTGMSTSTYTIVTKANGDLVTMFPGLPARLGEPILP